MKQFSLFFLLLLVSFSCSKNVSEKESEAVVVTDDFKSYRLDSDQPQERFADLIESVEVVRLEETENSLLSYLRSFQKTENNLVFNTSGQESDVLVHDLNGNFVKKINRKGDGPEEYEDINDLWLENDTLVIYSRAKSEVIRYNLEGDFIKKDKLPQRVGHIYGYKGGYALEMNDYLINDTSQYRYASLDKNLELTGLYLRVDDQMSEGMMWFSNNPIAPYKDGLTLFRMMSDTVYLLKENNFIPFVHFDFGSEWLWDEGRDLTGEIQNTDKVWAAKAYFNNSRIWISPSSGYSQEKDPPSFFLDRSTGIIDAVDMRKADKSKGIAYAMTWDNDRLIFTVQSPDMRSFLSELKEDQIKFRPGTTLKEIESSENPVLMWVKFKEED